MTKCNSSRDITPLQLKILKHGYYDDWGINATSIAESIWYKSDMDGKLSNLIIKVRRGINKLVDMGLLKFKLDAGVKFFELTPEGGTLVLNSIKSKQNSNSTYEQVDYDITPPKRFIGGANRYIALKHMEGKNYFNEHDRGFIARRFNNYVENTVGKKIILKSINGNQFKAINYTTRFNNKGRLKELLTKFDKIIDYEVANTEYAVFLTLTLDFKRFKDMPTANKEFQKGINKFMTYCRKYASFKFRYLCSYEFTKKGALHAHILIFGTKWLMKGSKISYLWSKQGIGKIVKAYALKNDGEKFIWARQMPKGTTVKSGTDYLKKYILKAFFDDDEERALYWLFNKRFYTYSRFYSKELMLTPIKPNNLNMWEFYGIFKENEIPLFVLNNLNKWSSIGWIGNAVYHSSGGIELSTKSEF
jgi:hypothetical protein